MKSILPKYMRKHTLHVQTSILVNKRTPKPTAAMCKLNLAVCCYFENIDNLLSVFLLNAL